VAALDALARRDRCTEDLRRKLCDKGYDADVVDTVIERLVVEKLIDDRRYAENFVAYHAGRGHGPLRVRADLRKCGTDSEAIDAAVDGYPDWLSQLRAAHRKKFGTRPPTHYAEQQRQARFLGYRGFTGAQIRLVLGFDTELDAD